MRRLINFRSLSLTILLSTAGAAGSDVATRPPDSSGDSHRLSTRDLVETSAARQGYRIGRFSLTEPELLALHKALAGHNQPTLDQVLKSVNHVIVEDPHGVGTIHILGRSLPSNDESGPATGRVPAAAEKYDNAEAAYLETELPESTARAEQAGVPDPLNAIRSVDAEGNIEMLSAQEAHPALTSQPCANLPDDGSQAEPADEILCPPKPGFPANAAPPPNSVSRLLPDGTEEVLPAETAHPPQNSLPAKAVRSFDNQGIEEWTVDDTRVMQ